MKLVLMQLGQRISKYKKRLIYAALVLFVGQICFFNLGGIGVQNEVFAADDGSSKSNTATQNSTFQDKATGWLKTLSLLKKVVYVLIYPILILAGKLVDNSLVYGEVFGFDAVLWDLRVMVRNLANFALGFIFIFYIFKYLISHDEKKGPKWIIIRALIAGVGIQASWFIMAALIDVSTILTYGVGGLPLSVLPSQDKESLKYNPYILSTVFNEDASDMDSSYAYLSNVGASKSENPDPKYISECEVFTYIYPKKEGVEGEKSEILILAPKMIYYQSYSGKEKKYYQTENNKCHLGDQVYFFSRLYSGLQNQRQQCNGSGCEEVQRQYQNSLNAAKNEIKATTGDIGTHISSWELLVIGTGNGLTGTARRGLDVNNERIGEEWGLKKLNDIMDGNTYVGVFTTLYSSLLNAGDGLKLAYTVENSAYVSLLNTLLSFGHVIAIGIPLIAMLVVFMMRIGILWMAVALSPMIVLLKAFGFEESISKKLKVKILEYLQVKNLIGIIFSPAIVCFAVSMSTVLVRIINEMNLDNINTKETPILGGIVTLNISGLGVSIGKLVCSVMGIAITWFLVWAAVKSSKLGESGLVTGLENLAKSSMGSIPLIPIPGKDGKGTEFIGVNTAFGLNGRQGIFSQMSDQITGKFNTKDNEAVTQWLNPEGAAKNRLAAYQENVGKLTIDGIEPDWTRQTIKIGNNGTSVTFYSFDNDGKKSIIESINGMNEKKREAFGKVGEIKIGDETWKFDPKEKKYSSQTQKTQ